MKIAIIGGSVAGLSMALALHKAGLAAETTIYEGYPKNDAQGGFSIAPHGTSVLAQLGLLDKYLERATHLVAFQMRDNNGALLGRMENSDPSLHTTPTLGITRTMLQNVMLEDVEAKKIPIQYNKRIVGIEEKDNRVIAKFQDGTQIEADILVGADGVNSFVRTHYVAPDAKRAEFTGFTGIGGAFDINLLPNFEQYLPTFGSTANLTVGPAGFIGWMVADKDKIMWWHHEYRDTPLSKEELKRENWEDWREKMKAKFSEYPAPIPDIIAVANMSVRHNIKKLDPIPRWSKGRVVLVGDAAHALGPSSGGASLALEDSLLLARLLRDNPYDKAFVAYEQERAPRLEAERKRQNGGLVGRTQTSWLAFKLKSWMMWLYFMLPKWNVNTTWSYHIDFDQVVKL